MENTYITKSELAGVMEVIETMERIGVEIFQAGLGGLSLSASMRILLDSSGQKVGYVQWRSDVGGWVFVPWVKDCLDQRRQPDKVVVQDY